MAAIMNVINKIIEAMKAFISRVESLGDKIITQLAIYSQKIGTMIITLMKGAFEKVKDGIMRIADTFKSAISQLVRRIKQPSISSGTSLMSKLKSLASEGFQKIISISKGFGNVVGSMLSAAFESLKSIGKLAVTGAVKTFDVVKTIAKEIITKLFDIGQFAIKNTAAAAKAVASGVAKSFTIAGSFVYKHGIAIAATASLSFFDPMLIISAAASAAMIVAAVNYEPGE